jgi:hypothetical protein
MSTQIRARDRPSQEASVRAHSHNGATSLTTARSRHLPQLLWCQPGRGIVSSTLSASRPHYFLAVSSAHRLAPGNPSARGDAPLPPSYPMASLWTRAPLRPAESTVHPPLAIKAAPHLSTPSHRSQSTPSPLSVHPSAKAPLLSSPLRGARALALGGRAVPTKDVPSIGYLHSLTLLCSSPLNATVLICLFVLPATRQKITVSSSSEAYHQCPRRCSSCPRVVVQDRTSPS